MTKSQLLETINLIHSDCHQLCFIAFAEYFEVSGNIGVFCQTDKEFEEFTKLRQKLTFPSGNPNQKYFRLIEPIICTAIEELPTAKYTHLYIRQPDTSLYGKYLGDVDFILEKDEYEQLKQRVINNEIAGAQMYDRPGWDTIQIFEPNIASVAYVSTMEMAAKARVKFD